MIHVWQQILSDRTILSAPPELTWAPQLRVHYTQFTTLMQVKQIILFTFTLIKFHFIPSESKRNFRIRVDSGSHPTNFYSRSGELRTQKLKSNLLRTQSLKVLRLKPEVGQYAAIYATLTDRDFFLANFYPSGPFTCIFSKTSPNFSCVGYG